MNLKQLTYFCAIAEEKSISKAARKLNVAQPPVSRQIALLEDELGAQLFLRNNKGVELTEAGKSLYRQSQNLFQNFRIMVDSVRDIGSGVRGTLKIGTVYSNVPLVLPHLKQYHEQFPEVELYFRLGSPKDLLQDLSRGELHVLFLRSHTTELPDLQVKVLGADPLQLIMTKELDPCPELSEVPISKLSGVPMCLLRSDDMWGYSSHFVNECRRNGFSPNVICECYDTPMAMQLVQGGFGIGYLPGSILQAHPNSNMYAKPIKHVRENSFPALVWSSSIYHANCVKQFIELF